MFDNCRPSGDSELDLLVRVVDNLNNILNTKAGYGYFISGFGVSDYSHYSSRDLIALSVIEEVKYNIDIFEPRIKCISVDYDKGDDASRLSFTINCRLREDARLLRLVLDPKEKRYFVSLP